MISVALVLMLWVAILVGAPRWLMRSYVRDRLWRLRDEVYDAKRIRGRSDPASAVMVDRIESVIVGLSEVSVWTLRDLRRASAGGDRDGRETSSIGESTVAVTSSHAEKQLHDLVRLHCLTTSWSGLAVGVGSRLVAPFARRASTAPFAVAVEVAAARGSEGRVFAA